MTRLETRLAQCEAMPWNALDAEWSYTCERAGLADDADWACPCSAYQRGLADRALLLRLDAWEAERLAPGLHGHVSQLGEKTEE